MSAEAVIITIDGGYSLTDHFEKNPPVNWPLIVGTIAAVLVVGPGTFSELRKRATRTKGRLN